jgi:hypothetical protein
MPIRKKENKKEEKKEKILYITIGMYQGNINKTIKNIKIDSIIIEENPPDFLIFPEYFGIFPSGKFDVNTGIKNSEEIMPQNSSRFIISVFGPEKAGVVAAISSYLAQEQLSIQDISDSIPIASGGTASKPRRLFERLSFPQAQQIRKAISSRHAGAGERAACPRLKSAAAVSGSKEIFIEMPRAVGREIAPTPWLEKWYYKRTSLSMRQSFPTELFEDVRSYLPRRFAPANRVLPILRTNPTNRLAWIGHPVWNDDPD